MLIESDSVTEEPGNDYEEATGLGGDIYGQAAAT